MPSHPYTLLKLSELRASDTIFILSQIIVSAKWTSHLAHFQSTCIKSSQIASANEIPTDRILTFHSYFFTDPM
jgi:hypothetical protein